MSKHTPGPWDACESAICDGSANVIALVSPAHMGERNEGAANARLIASSPELLEALEELLAAQVCDDCGLCDKARAAIRKAKGDA